MKAYRPYIIKDIVLIACCLISLFVISPKVSNLSTYKKSVATLDEKKANVLTLTGITAGASFAVSALGDDTGSPIANKLADFSGYFLVITVAIYIEEWLMAIAGVLAFRLVIPLGCILLLILSFWDNPHTIKASVTTGKVMVFTIILAIVVPCSTWISRQIDIISQETTSQRIENVEKDSKEIIPENDGSEDDSSFLSAVSSLWSKFVGGVKAVVAKFNALIQNLIDITAAMIVTSCVIPLLVFVFLICITNIIFGTAFKIPDLRKLKAHRHAPWIKKDELDDEEYDEIEKNEGSQRIE